MRTKIVEMFEEIQIYRIPIVIYSIVEIRKQNIFLTFYKKNELEAGRRTR